MIGTSKDHLSQLLRFAAEALDMPEDLFQKAEQKYNEVGNYLAAADSPLRDNMPEIYPQGSTLLGTLTRPILDNDEFDIDLVCLLQIKKQSISQKDLKKRIGDRLRANSEYQRVLGESRRCWTLSFEKQFHMDVLPAIPDEDGKLESILITDKELIHWQHSDPKSYANWFWSRMQFVFDQEKRALAKALQADIDDIPNWKVKTPLQRAIQLLKRHRDIHFQNDNEDKPISIIICTLAAHAYSGQSNLFDALIQIVRKMPDFVQSRNGIYWVPNPANPAENFCDKWQEYPQRRRKFYSWLNQIDTDLTTALRTQGIREITDQLGCAFGQSIMQKATKRLGFTAQEQRKAGDLFMTAGMGTLGISGNTRVKNHTFHGEVS